MKVGDNMDKIAIQKKIAKMDEVNCHYDQTYITANYTANFKRAKNRYNTVEQFAQSIKNTVDVEIETTETKIGKKDGDRVFIVKIKI
jgi:hypothetical protein